jgi:hypothetical protein
MVIQFLIIIDPTTGWFQIAEIPTKKADYVSNVLQQTWLVDTHGLQNSYVTQAPNSWPRQTTCSKINEYSTVSTSNSSPHATHRPSPWSSMPVLTKPSVN